MGTFDDEMTAVTDGEIGNEVKLSRTELREAVNSRRVVIPAVSTRPAPPQASRSTSSSAIFSSNILNEQLAQALEQKVLRPHQMRCAPGTLRLLSYGIEQHFANIIDVASAHSRKRSNRTATEHFNKTQKLMSIDKGSSTGEVAPENRLNLGMMWGRDIGVALSEDSRKREIAFISRYADEEESLRVELQQIDDERKANSRKRNKTEAESAAASSKNWWVKEVS